MDPTYSRLLGQTPNRRGIVAIRPDGKPSPYFHLNLPYDYEELSFAGQHEARLNGVMLQGPDPELFVRAWVLFRTYYLAQLPDGVFYKGRLPSPPCHYDAIRDLAAYQLNAWAFPRGSGKSTVLGKEIPMLFALTRPNYDILMILAKETFVVKRLSSFMLALTDTKYIADDFGSVRMNTGGRMWTQHLLHLANGSTITGMPVEGKMLGERPDIILPDDPEHDKGAGAIEAPGKMIAAMEHLLLGILMPMLRVGSCLGWIGTLLSRRSFLYHIMHSRDPQYQFWNRRILAGLKADGSSLWPERWSTGELARLRIMWTEEQFQAQMQNKPGLGNAALLKINPKYHLYHVSNEDDVFGVNPLVSGAKLHTVRPVSSVSESGEREVVDHEYVRSYGETVSRMDRIMLVDFAYTVSSKSDYSCIQVVGYENNETHKDILYSLDLWLGKKTSAKLVPIILTMAAKWKVRLIVVEAISIQQMLVEQVSAGLDLLAKTPGWMPKVMPLRYPPNFPKAHRIAGLEWRFTKNRIALPGDRRDVWPYKMLFTQIENFTLDLSRLPVDDAIDTLAMFQFVGKSRNQGDNVPNVDVLNSDPAAAMRQGRVRDDFGIPVGSRLPVDAWPMDDLMAVSNQTREDGSIVWNNA